MLQVDINMIAACILDGIFMALFRPSTLSKYFVLLSLGNSVIVEQWLKLHL